MPHRTKDVAQVYNCYVRSKHKSTSLYMAVQQKMHQSQLLREIKAQGYQGLERAVYRYLSYLRTEEERVPHRAVQPQEDFSAKRAVWLLIQASESLDESQQHTLAFIRQTSSQVEQGYKLAHRCAFTSRDTV